MGLLLEILGGHFGQFLLRTAPREHHHEIGKVWLRPSPSAGAHLRRTAARPPLRSSSQRCTISPRKETASHRRARSQRAIDRALVILAKANNRLIAHHGSAGLSETAVHCVLDRFADFSRYTDHSDIVCSAENMQPMQGTSPFVGLSSFAAQDMRACAFNPHSWHCSCGTPNWASRQTCRSCNMNRAALAPSSMCASAGLPQQAYACVPQKQTFPAQQGRNGQLPHTGAGTGRRNIVGKGRGKGALPFKTPPRPHLLAHWGPKCSLSRSQ